MAKKETKAQELKNDLFYSTENLWDTADTVKTKAVMDFCTDYKKALDEGKTEREFYSLTVRELEANGFKPLDVKKKLKAGDKVYRGIHGKGLIAAVVGTEAPENGLMLVGSHTDSPRLDLKPNPIYEKNELVLFKTHYYGGIKKYQWAAVALALHGVLTLKNGKQISITIGEDENDPVLTITDLLPHLGADQMQRKANEVLKGEELNVLIGGLPFPDKDVDQRFKLGVLKLLNEKYGVTERDFCTAELEVVPAQKAKCVGFDRSFVGAYGQDDRVCAYTSLKALLDVKGSRKTHGIVLFDKEETGSDGNTGAQSKLYSYALNELHTAILGREPSMLETDRMMSNTQLLSSDVTNGFDPTFADVSDPLNNSYCGHGIAISKYTGSRGKGGTSDASSEFVVDITNIFDRAGIAWQISEMGKVDQGGGGTIAKHFAALGMQVLDCGVPVLSMHSCFELCSKIDIYETYLAYKAFLMA